MNFISKKIFNISYIFIISIAISGTKSYGQNAIELGQAVINMKGSNDLELQKKAAQIENLMYYVQPTLYIENNTEKVYGKTSATNVYVDANSIEKLKEANSHFANVELLTIVLNSPDEMKFVLDIESLQSFTNLKYINVKCNFELATENSINNLFINNSKISIYYTISREG